jgi:hypothetical protein
MAKKAKPRQQQLSDDELEQLDTLDIIRSEIKEFHEIALIEMSNNGVLPPFYAGEYLGENREVIPMWAFGEDNELGALLLRVCAGVEPNRDLQDARTELDLINDWPMSELMDTLVDEKGQSIIVAGEQYRDLSVIFPLLPTQVHPAPGYDQATMFKFIAEMKPYAVFVRVPTTETEDTVDYLWDEFERYHAEVVYADSPQLLETAVWEYRLNYAMAAEALALVKEGAQLNLEMLAQNAADLAAHIELDVMRGMRVYGTTSPIRAKQEELDILRDESGDLVIPLPLKPSVEPVGMIAYEREHLEHSGDTLLTLGAESEAMRRVWPEIRAHSYFCIRIRSGNLVEAPNGKVMPKGYLPEPMLEWYMAETLPDLYRIARLTLIYEMLACCGFIRPKVKVF